MNLNQSFFRLIFQFSGKYFFLDGLAVFIAQYLPYLLVLGFLILVFRESGFRRRLLLFCEGAMAVILARGLLTEIIRFFYHHPRPFDVYEFMPLIAERGYSFPSGHAAWFFALALTVLYANKKWGMWFFILAILNGLARIYCGVHWPGDILGGFIVGVASGWIVHKLVLSYWREIENKKAGESISLL